MYFEYLAAECLSYFPKSLHINNIVYSFSVKIVLFILFYFLGGGYTTDEKPKITILNININASAKHNNGIRNLIISQFDIWKL